MAIPFASRYSFELCQRDQQKVIFKAESHEEKNAWMASLGKRSLIDLLSNKQTRITYLCVLIG